MELVVFELLTSKNLDVVGIEFIQNAVNKIKKKFLILK